MRTCYKYCFIPPPPFTDYIVKVIPSDYYYVIVNVCSVPPIEILFMLSLI